MPTPALPAVRRACAVATACLLFVLTAPVARAEDPTPEQVQAREIGRDLLSPDAKVRERAVAQLLARIGKGGDAEPFLREVSAAARTWADHRERLMDKWVEQAVNGSAAEREEAVRLLAALGADAVRRLAEEVRRARRAKGVAGSGGGSGSDESKKRPSGGTDEPTVTPRIYDLHDLLAGGVHRLTLRGLLQKASDATEVRSLPGGVYIVTAREEGHTTLRVRLESLRTGMQTIQELRASERPNPAPKPDAGPAGPEDDTTPAEPAPQEAAVADSPPPPRAKTMPPPEAKVQDPRTWHVSATILHVPRRALASRGSFQGQARRNDALPGGLDPVKTEVRVGSRAQVRGWAAELRRLPDARQAPDVKGSPLLSATIPARLSSGTRHSYARALTRTKGGAWQVVMDTLLQGFELEVRGSPHGDELGLHVVASRTEVGLPMPVEQVRPARDAAPVTLERPEWSTTRAHAEFALPAEGGGAFLSLGGLASEEADHVVVLLFVTPTK